MHLCFSLTLLDETLYAALSHVGRNASPFAVGAGVVVAVVDNVVVDVVIVVFTVVVD